MGDIRIFSLTARRQGRAQHMSRPSKQSEQPMADPIQLPVLITVEETAMLLRVCRGRIYELIRKKLLRSVKIGNSRRVVLASVYDYIQRLSDDDDAA
jgi:excisionase family DNA binding protein